MREGIFADHSARVVRSRPLGVPKSASVGNLIQMAKDAIPATTHDQPHRKGSTFDDILKGMEQDKGKSKKRFPFS
jgi:hypothetical protein